MNTKKILLYGFILVLMSSCVKYLDPYPQGNKDSENIWDYQSNIQGMIGWCYDNMSRNYNDNEGAYLDGATDNAVITSSTSAMRRLAVNTITTGQDPFQTYWDEDYRMIRNVNLFLKDRRGYNTRYSIDKHYNDLIKTRLQGEAFAIRAWSEWDLLKKFGGKGVNGEMLGFPITTDVIGIEDNKDYARNTYDECVAQIIADCDSAYKYLPIAHRDFLVPAADVNYSGGKYWGRFDGITMRAIKANVYMTWASPRFNPGNVVARWDSAAVNAKQVMDFKLTVDHMSDGDSFREANGVSWGNPNFGGIVFSSRYNTNNESMELMFYPGGFQGNGDIGATQELVDAFGMANGRPITDPLSGYDPANPYAGRDPRFYATIFYNKATANRDNGSSVMYTFENWQNGGKDAAGVIQNNSLTNYHIKKFIYMGWNRSDASLKRLPRSKFFIRWAHMVLTFAEAANHVVGPEDAAKYGMSAKAAIKYLRVRKTYDNKNGLSGTDPYLDEVAAAGETAFDEFVKNERRIELCFEGSRFYDLRRWTTDANWESVINQSVHGAMITLNPDNTTFTYDLAHEVEPRLFQSPYLPIPYNEILRMSKLVQNEGWETWN